MQQIIIEKPYRFIPPYRSTVWSTITQRLNLHGIYLRHSDGVVSHEIRGLAHIQESLRAGHGILLTPNHCRYGDPLLMGWLARAAHCHVYAMASWHLYHQSRFTAWAIRRVGGFSVSREGMDRQSINTAINILEAAERPLILFPEGAVSHTNDRLLALLDGVAFIARTAARRRAKRIPGGKVVMHPVAIKYRFGGDLEKCVDGVLTAIEQRLAWRPQRDLPMLKRISKVGHALLSLKEIEYFQEIQQGGFTDRLERFINRLLQPLELEWLGDEKTGPVVPRVKTLRMQIVPPMIRNEVSSDERARRWQQLADIYLAQQLYSYPPDYLSTLPTVDRILETIERYEEDLTDKSRVHGSLHAIIEVGEGVEVSPQRDRGSDVDPLMELLEHRLQGMLDRLALESPLYSGATVQESNPDALALSDRQAG